MNDIDRFVIPGSLSFLNRPAGWLAQLRSQRLIDFAAKVKAKRSSKGTGKSPAKQPLSVDLNNFIAGLDPVLAQSVVSQLASATKRKTRKKS